MTQNMLIMKNKLLISCYNINILFFFVKFIYAWDFKILSLYSFNFKSNTFFLFHSQNNIYFVIHNLTELYLHIWDNNQSKCKINKVIRILVYLEQKIL